jgi:hypothetical protein
MVRISNNPRPWLMCLAALAGCSSSSDGSSGGSAGAGDTSVLTGALKVVFAPMYSAYDGVHDYKLPATIDQAALDPNAIDPVLMDTVKWTADDKFVAKEPYPDLPGGVLLTTKAAGTTTVTATASTQSGRKVNGTAILQITQATADEWALGEARYNNNVMINLGMFGGMTGAAGAGMMATGGVPDISTLIPRNASCANCHNNTSGITVEHTPQQTAGYSDDDLIMIFTQGAKPMGATFNSQFLKGLPAEFAMTIYKALHTWDIAAEVQRGLVFKLRSIGPAPQPAIDITRLRPGGAGAATAGAAAAAGAGSASTAGAGGS